MSNKITKEEYPDIWPLITDDVYEESSRKHRRGSNFFVNWVYKLDGETFPNNPELWGYWETDTLIHDTEWGLDEKPAILHRVEPTEKIIVQKQWERLD